MGSWGKCKGLSKELYYQPVAAEMINQTDRRWQMLERREADVGLSVRAGKVVGERLHLTQVQSVSFTHTYLPLPGSLGHQQGQTRMTGRARPAGTGAAGARLGLRSKEGAEMIRSGDLARQGPCLQSL